MIALAESINQKKPSTDWHDGFLAMVPGIRKYVNRAFRHTNGVDREELVSEAIANALQAYVRLLESDKVDLAYPTVLARYAVYQIRAGRRVGNRTNTKDVLSPAAQQRHGFVVDNFARLDERSGEWVDAIVEDTRTPIADQVAFRCDFPEWLARLPERNRQIASYLSLGYSSGEASTEFQVSSSRISQLRRTFRDSWAAFHGEALSETGV